MQPIRRFGMDGAILFSDILVIPQALGQNLRFAAGEGPRLNPIQSQDDLEKLSGNNLDQILSPIYETIALTRQKLAQESFDHTALIGFAGAPWTVACYMVQGRGSKDFNSVFDMIEHHQNLFDQIIEIVTQATIHYLKQQIHAGVEAIQIFDSWAGLLKGDLFDQYSIQPTLKIINAIREEFPDIPIIGFPRSVGENIIPYIQTTKVNAVGLSEDYDLDWVLENIPSDIAIQGNLSNQALLKGGDDLIIQVRKILDKFSNRPFIFNLGHGIIKETPIAHVEQLCRLIKDYK